MTETASINAADNAANAAANAALARLHLVCPRLPLAVYREVVAHLRQVEGIEAELLPQTSQQFDYPASQAGGICLRYTAIANATSQQRVEQILRYYADRFGNWERLSLQS